MNTLELKRRVEAAALVANQEDPSNARKKLTTDVKVNGKTVISVKIPQGTTLRFKFDGTTVRPKAGQWVNIVPGDDGDDDYDDRRPRRGGMENTAFGDFPSPREFASNLFRPSRW